MTNPPLGFCLFRHTSVTYITPHSYQITLSCFQRKIYIKELPLQDFLLFIPFSIVRCIKYLIYLCASSSSPLLWPGLPLIIESPLGCTNWWLLIRLLPYFWICSLPPLVDRALCPLASLIKPAEIKQLYQISYKKVFFPVFKELLVSCVF